MTYGFWYDTPGETVGIGDPGGYWYGAPMGAGLGALPVAPATWGQPTHDLASLLAIYRDPNAPGSGSYFGRAFRAAMGEGYVPDTPEGLGTLMQYMTNEDAALRLARWDFSAFITKTLQGDVPGIMQSMLDLMYASSQTDPRYNDFPGMRRAYEAEFGETWRPPAGYSGPGAAPPAVTSFATAEGTFPLDPSTWGGFVRLSPAEIAEGRDFLRLLTFGQLATAMSLDARLASALVGMGVPMSGLTSGPNVMGSVVPPHGNNELVGSAVVGPVLAPAQHPWAMSGRLDPRPNYGAAINPEVVTWVRALPLWVTTFDPAGRYPAALGADEWNAQFGTQPVVQDWTDTLAPAPAPSLLVERGGTGNASLDMGHELMTSTPEGVVVRVSPPMPVATGGPSLAIGEADAPRSPADLLANLGTGMGVFAVLLAVGAGYMLLGKRRR